MLNIILNSMSITINNRSLNRYECCYDYLFFFTKMYMRLISLSMNTWNLNKTNSSSLKRKFNY